MSTTSRAAENVREKGSDAPDNGAAPIPAAGTRGTFQAICLVMTCTFAMIVNNSNNTSVTIAMPKIQSELNIADAKLQWLVSAYSLSSGCLLLFFGRLADLHGRKKTFLIGSLFLTVFTLACGFAKDELTLDILRGFQGIGAAATIPASLGILAHAFPPGRARSAAFATFAAGAPLGASIGLSIGGVLTQLSRPSWRSTFFLTAGLTLLCFLGGMVSIPADLPLPASVDRRVDWIGAGLVTVGLVLIVFVLSDGEVAAGGWATSYIIALLVVGVFFVLLFLIWEHHLERVHAQEQVEEDEIVDAEKKIGEDGVKADAAGVLKERSTVRRSRWTPAPNSKWTPPPLMKLSVWKRANGRFAVVQWIAFLAWMTFISWNFWIQLYYQNFKHYSPILTMLRMVPMMITGVICNVVVALFVGHVPLVYLMVSGTLLTSTAAILFAVIDPSKPYWTFGFPAAVLSVFGADFVFASGTIFVAKVVTPDEQSVAGGLFQTMTQLGTALGLTITTIVFNRVVKREAELVGQDISVTGTASASPAAQLKGYRSAQWTCFAFGIFASLLGIAFLRKVGVVGHHEGRRTKSENSTIAEGDDTDRV
ncbi:hypothetical protein PLICRDRAFT_39748 [Plicaturopsis crispa FD-325 SS-3]|nr:hypothetical protein PLICRDRAFT_39748 [Plicaturopsis crispa FD-325 SS-3]